MSPPSIMITISLEGRGCGGDGDGDGAGTLVDIAIGSVTSVTALQIYI